MTVQKTSHILAEAKETLKGETLSLSLILEVFHERGFGFILLLFALPMALPIPVPPGINILMALPLLILTAQQALGRHTIWMPKRLKQKTITRQKFIGLIDMILPFIRRLEALVKPRLSFMTQGIFSNLIGILGFIMALSVCVPLPLTNTVPSLGIALMAIGVLSRDGLAVLAGAFIGMLWITMLGLAILFLGSEGIDFVKDTIKSFF